jgi:ATP-dependent protease ClpP protease subunit
VIEKILRKELNFSVEDCVQKGIIDGVYDKTMD